MSEPVPAADGAGLAAEANSSPDAIARLYDTWASGGGYDRDVQAWGYEAPERVAAMVAGLVPDGGRVLDAGCGTGRVGVALRAAGVVGVTGGDFSLESVAKAGRLGVYDTVQHLDLNAPVEFADGHFDVTVSVGVFSYLTDTAATLAELLRVVKPAGAVIFTQRTDLWEERDTQGTIDELVSAGACTAAISEVSPYLPGHPDFGDSIGIRYVTLIRAV
ncbi:MAG: class I SAM-dependent methyltransferase [Ilumatobacter sp.]